MSLIEKLTPEQEAQIPIYYDEWYKWGTCTDAADRPKAEQAVIGMLKEAGKYNNQRIVWCDSPLVAELLQNILNDVSLDGSLSDLLWASLKDSLWMSLSDSLKASLDSSLWASLWDSLSDSLCDSLKASLGASLSVSLDSSLEKTKLKYYGTWFDGHIDSYWVCFYKFCRDVIGVKYQEEKSRQLDLHIDLCQSAGRVYFYEKMVLICERPSLIKFNEKRLHNDGAPAVQYRDGFSFWALNGVRVPQYLAETPVGELDIEFFKKEQNAEVRAQFVRKYGIERMRALGKVVDSKDDYELIDMSPIFANLSYAPYLKMVNPSTGTIHMEGVHPDCKTVEQALNWRNQEEEMPVQLT